MCGSERRKREDEGEHEVEVRGSGRVSKLPSASHFYESQFFFRNPEPILIYSADWWRLGCVSFVARARGRGRLRAGTILSLLANQIRKTAFFVRQVPPERDQHRHKWPFLVEVGNQEHAIYGNHCQC